MKNKEKFAKEIIEIAATGSSIAMRKLRNGLNLNMSSQSTR